MPEPKHRHNGGPLSDEDRRKFWAHIRALEVLEEQKADIMLDVKCRKELAKADGFDTNIMGVVLKRRKAGEGETLTADALLQLYEDALRDQGVMPLEQTRQPTPPRRTVEEIADQLHGEPPPPMPEKAADGVMDAARALDDLARKNGATMTVTGGGTTVRFGGGGMFDPPDDF
jgi:uncharacterized protein (UPF0335 family)